MQPKMRVQKRLTPFLFCRLRFFVALLPLFLAAAAVGADTDTSEEKLAQKEVTGQVTHIGKRAISVEFSRKASESTEMLLPITEETRLERLRSLAELKPGDTVRVQYQQTYKDGDKGERIILGTTATRVALVRTAPRQGLSSTEDQLK